MMLLDLFVGWIGQIAAVLIALAIAEYIAGDDGRAAGGRKE